MTKEELIEEHKRLSQMNLILLKLINKEDVENFIYVDKCKDKIMEKLNRLRKCAEIYEQTDNIPDLEICEIKIEILEEIIKEIND
jgi:chromosome condensin MukBEF MukE localization factor